MKPAVPKIRPVMEAGKLNLGLWVINTKPESVPDCCQERPPGLFSRRVVSNDSTDH